MMHIFSEEEILKLYEILGLDVTIKDRVVITSYIGDKNLSLVITTDTEGLEIING